jgi:hypothetical protein
LATDKQDTEESGQRETSKNGDKSLFFFCEKSLKSREILASLAVVCSIILLFSLMPRNARATTFYTYKWTYNWSFWAWYYAGWGSSSDAELQNDAISGMNDHASLEFARLMAQNGYWYKINSVSSACTMSQKTFMGESMEKANFTGTTIIQFESDLNQGDYTGFGSQRTLSSQTTKYMLISAPIQPTQIADLLIAILYGILFAVVTYPLLVAIIVLITIITIALWILIKTGAQAINDLGKDLGSIIITIVLVIGGLIGLYFVFGFVTQGGLEKLRFSKRKSKTKMTIFPLGE